MIFNKFFIYKSNFFILKKYFTNNPTKYYDNVGFYKIKLQNYFENDLIRLNLYKLIWKLN